jgi:fatty acid amide hydrolase 2
MNFAVRFLVLLLHVLYVLITPILWLKSRKKKQTIPTISDGLLKISATELAAKIRKREVSSEQVCTAYIKRIKEVNPFLNAIVEERFESALQDARNIDSYLRESLESEEELEKTRPLLGVPLTVKESCSLEGLSLCGGTLSRAGIKASTDSEVVAKLKASGAVALLVSNTPEICLSWESNNFITGRTNNPYDTTRTSSGSSGGEVRFNNSRTRMSENISGGSVGSGRFSNRSRFRHRRLDPTTGDVQWCLRPQTHRK